MQQYEIHIINTEEGAVITVDGATLPAVQLAELLVTKSGFKLDFQVMEQEALEKYTAKMLAKMGSPQPQASPYL